VWGGCVGCVGWVCGVGEGVGGVVCGVGDFFENKMVQNYVRPKDHNNIVHTMCPADTATAGSWAGVGLVN
jgi:hypothetical protein